MTPASTLFEQSELALAAYATLASGIPNSAELVKDSTGMSVAQASDFAQNWTVIAPTFNDPAGSGASATLFQNNATGEITLAVRGTELTTGDLTADGLLALGIPSSLNPQFTALQNQISTWQQAGGPLSGGVHFNVSGHSLGGYLAYAVAQANPNAVTSTYMFNAPGVGGLTGTLAEALTSLLGLTGTAPANVFNVRASEGFPVISGVGYPPGTPITIKTEAASNPLANHSIKTFTDAIAIQVLYSKLDPSLSQDSLNALVAASGPTPNQLLAPALDALRQIVLGPGTAATPVGDRNALYQNLDDPQLSAGISGLVGAAQVAVLAPPYFDNPTDQQIADVTASLVAQAKTGSALGLATRYALSALNSFALVGASYSAFDANGELDLFNPAAGLGTESDQYLADRAAMLERKMWFSTQAKSPVDTSIVFDPSQTLFQNEAATWVDVASGYTIQQGLLFDNTQRFVFGGTGNDTLTGAGVADHLYGGAGNDILDAGAGDDYLEGGRGDDTLKGGNGNDTYAYLAGDGNDTIQESGGSADVLQLTGIASSQATLAKLGNDLRIGFSDGGDVTIADWYLDDSHKIESFQFQDTALSRVQIEAGATEKTYGSETNDVLAGSGLTEWTDIYGMGGNDTLYGASGQNYLSGGAGSDNLFGGAASDILSGGDAGTGSGDIDNFFGRGGNDTLIGSLAHDVFNFMYGDGADTVFTGDSSGGDTLAFDQSFVQSGASLVAHRSDNDLLISASSGDSVTVKDWFSGQQAEVSVIDQVYVPGYRVSPRQYVLPHYEYVNQLFSASTITDGLAASGSNNAFQLLAAPAP